MTHTQALKLAVESMKLEIKGLAQQANLHDQYGLEDVHCVKASKKRKQLREALETLESKQ